MAMNLEEQYDKIYRYCYFKVHHKETAEDITQETFLRFFSSSSYQDTGIPLHYLYTIAKNLCTDHFRKIPSEPLPDSFSCPDTTDQILTKLALQTALSELPPKEQELLLLRYVNEVPVTDLCKILDISRFSVYRKTTAALKHLEHLLERGKNI